MQKADSWIESSLNRVLLNRTVRQRAGRFTGICKARDRLARRGKKAPKAVMNYTNVHSS